jgi:predicted small lipoprotein YifL
VDSAFGIKPMQHFFKLRVVRGGKPGPLFRTMRYGAATFRSLSMSSSLSLARMVMVAGLVAIGVSACGRRGALEPPPSASAQATATQQQPTAGESTLPSPVGTPRSTPRQGYTIPNKPFILDPLL